MRIYLFFLFSFFSIIIFAQKPVASLTILSEKGDMFFIYINGHKVNTKPMSKVKVENLDYVYYALKVEYDDASHYTIEKNKFFVCNKKGELRDMTYELVREDSEMKLKFVSMQIPTGNATSSENFAFDFNEIGKNTVAQPKQDKSPIQQPKEEVVSKKEIPKDTIVTNKLTTEIQQISPAKESIVTEKTPVEEANSNIVNALVLMEPKNWVCKNEWPMLRTDYAKVYKVISIQNTDADKLKLAKELASKNCLKTDQVIEMAALITNEAERLDFVKFSYSHTIDIKNYLKAEKLFNTEKSKSSFQYFISH
jgi:hypothetical protein